MKLRFRVKCAGTNLKEFVIEADEEVVSSIVDTLAAAYEAGIDWEITTEPQDKVERFVAL
jgi:hypothetical protein